MKFIYFSDFHLPIDQVISDAELSQFTTLDSLEAFSKHLSEECILLLVLDKPLSQEILTWRKGLQHQTFKVVLLSNTVDDKSLISLQRDHNFYDLVFKYPISFDDLKAKVKLISTFTHNTWKPELPAAEPTLQITDFDIGNLTDQVSLTTSPTVDTDVITHAEVPATDDSLSLIDGLTGEANIDLSLESPDTLILSDKATEELESENGLTDALMLGTEELPQELPEALSEPQIPQIEVKAENLWTDSESPLDLGIDDQSSLKISEPTSPNVNVEKVSLNEILENKDDQIYRLMSKNKMLEDEVIEKEEFIKQLQIDLRELQTSFDKNKNIVEESTYQVNILKSNNEQEKLEIKKNLDVALAKVKLLEARIDELKNSSSAQPRNTDTTLSIGELRKLKARQEHLEEKISLLQSDSAIQLQHREKKIIDLKRKVDLLEFDVKDSIEREAELKRKLQIAESKMAQTKQLLKQVMDEPAVSSGIEIVKKTGSYDI